MDINNFNFESIKKTIEQNYPTPIALVFKKSRTALENDLGGKHKNIIDLFEVFIKTITIISLQEVHKYVPNLKELLPQKEKTLEFLKHPSLGHWVGLLRTLCKLEAKLLNVPILKEVSAWYHTSRNEKTSKILSIFNDIDTINFQSSSKTPIAEICNVLVTYRNKEFAHSANLSNELLIKRLPLLEQIISYLMLSAGFLKDLRVIFTEEIKINEEKTWDVRAKKLVGISEEPITLKTSEQLDLKEIYVIYDYSETKTKSIIALTPFILLNFNDLYHREEIYFFNNANRTNLDYLSYLSGSHYYHKELKKGFDDLIQLKLHVVQEDSEITNLSEKERTEIAEELFKKSLIYKKQNKYEDALELLEKCVEYERRTKTFVEMINLQIILNDPLESIEFNIMNCLELDPNNEIAHAFRRQINENGSLQLEDHLESNNEEKKVITIFHVFTPKKFRQLSILWWSTVLIAWYSLSYLIELLFGNSFYIIPIIFQLILSTLCVFVISTSGKLLKKLYLPLSLQIDNMRLERFSTWFQNQLSLIYGKYKFRNKSFNLRESFKQEKIYFTGSILFGLFLLTAAFFLSGTNRQPFPLNFIRTIDYGIMYIIISFSLRYVLMTTVFIFNFGREISLKPMLSKINDDGIRSWGRLISFNISFVVIAYLNYWLLAMNVVKLNTFYDFIFVIIATFIVAFWTIGLPYMVYYAAKEAKSKAVHLFSSHLENSFHNYLNDPTNDTREKYLWLLSNQKDIKKIPTWPLSLGKTIFIILGSNVVVILINIVYIMVRLGYIVDLTTYIQDFLSNYL